MLLEKNSKYRCLLLCVYVCVYVVMMPVTLMMSLRRTGIDFAFFLTMVR